MLGWRATDDPPGSPVGPAATGWKDRLRSAGPLAVPLLVLTVAQWTGTLVGPALLARHPLPVTVLSPRAPFLAFASTQSPFLLFLVVATVRLVLADPVNYLLGRRFGPGVSSWISGRGRRAGRLISSSERFFDRWGLVAVALRPNQVMLVLAGSRGLRPSATFAAATAGTVAYVVLLAATAGAVAGPVALVASSCGPAVGGVWASCSGSPLAVAASLSAAATVAAVVGMVWLRSRRGVARPALVRSGR